MTNTNPSFSLNDFRKWLADSKKLEHKSEKKDSIVESRIGLSHLESQVKKHNPNLAEPAKFAKAFKEEGAKVLQANGDALLLEIKLGSFLLPKLYVK